MIAVLPPLSSGNAGVASLIETLVALPHQIGILTGLCRRAIARERLLFLAVHAKGNG
jgi:uncharacterized membrane protein (DUF441 family)